MMYRTVAYCVAAISAGLAPGCGESDADSGRDDSVPIAGGAGVDAATDENHAIASGSRRHTETDIAGPVGQEPEVHSSSANGVESLASVEADAVANFVGFLQHYQLHENFAIVEEWAAALEWGPAPEEFLSLLSSEIAFGQRDGEGLRFVGVNPTHQSLSFALWRIDNDPAKAEQLLRDLIDLELLFENEEFGMHRKFYAATASGERLAMVCIAYESAEWYDDALILSFIYHPTAVREVPKLEGIFQRIEKR